MHQQIDSPLCQWSSSRRRIKVTSQIRVKTFFSLRGLSVFTGGGLSGVFRFKASTLQTGTSRFLEPQVLMQFLPMCDLVFGGGVTVMDSCKLGTNKSLRVLDLGPIAPVYVALQETHSKLNPPRLPGYYDAFPVPHARS